MSLCNGTSQKKYDYRPNKLLFFVLVQQIQRNNESVWGVLVNQNKFFSQCSIESHRNVGGFDFCKPFHPATALNEIATNIGLDYPQLFLVLKTSKNGDPTSPLGNLFLFCIAFLVKKLFLI